MWLNFVISVGVVAFFLTRMAAALKERERELAAAREDALRNEQILSLGTLAAGAAHQLGTPLGTMAVVIRELELNHGSNAELQEDLLLLREQVDRCKQTISQILASTGQERDECLRSLPLDAYLHRLLDEWQIIRPHALAQRHLQGCTAGAADRRRPHARAGDPQPARQRCRRQRRKPRSAAFFSPLGCRHLPHRDSRPWPGLDGESAQRLGEAFFSTKAGTPRPRHRPVSQQRHHRALRWQGRTCNRDDPQGGACTRVTLPLNRLKA
jgi:two-component system sensor histidine kinase RegB